VPGSAHVNLARLLDLAGGATIHLAEETELRRLFPGCEVGAMPPFGPIYGQTVYVDAVLAMEPEVTFNAGTHRDAIAMRWTDFVKVVNPMSAGSRSSWRRQPRGKEGGPRRTSTIGGITPGSQRRTMSSRPIDGPRATANSFHQRSAICPSFGRSA
jgi:hypothetical protein